MAPARRHITRTETDALGSLAVPFNALYGAQTERALANFPVSGVVIGQFPELISALAEIKKAAAATNAKLGILADEKAAIIGRVCDELI